MSKLYIALLAISQIIIFAEIFFVTKKIKTLEDFSIKFFTKKEGDDERH